MSTFTRFPHDLKSARVVTGLSTGRPEAGLALAGITAAIRTPQLLYSTGDNFRDK